MNAQRIREQWADCIPAIEQEVKVTETTNADGTVTVRLSLDRTWFEETVTPDAAAAFKARSMNMLVDTRLPIWG